MITVDEFKVKLRDKSISDLDIVQRYLTHEPPFVFEGDEDKYFKLKRAVAQNFELNPQEVIMIGSSKLGFSISPRKLWEPFHDESDIDMVIISATIFNKFWKDLYDFNFNINLTDRTDKENKQYYRFLEYFFRGWLRPDVFPFSYLGRKEWEDFFKSISYGEFGDHKINGAVFRDWGFYEAYHTSNIREIRNGGVV